MANICTLAPDINQCPHYDQETQMCKDGPEVCGFYKKNRCREGAGSAEAAEMV